MYAGPALGGAPRSPAAAAVVARILFLLSRFRFLRCACRGTVATLMAHVLGLSRSGAGLRRGLGEASVSGRELVRGAGQGMAGVARAARAAGTASPAAAAEADGEGDVEAPTAAEAPAAAAAAAATAALFLFLAAEFFCALERFIGNAVFSVPFSMTEVCTR